MPGKKTTRTPAADALPPGIHRYEDILRDCGAGRRRFARARAASGRLHWLIGITPEFLAAARGAARRHRVGLVLQGSRISGPRTAQRKLHPALAACLPLKTYRRAGTALYPETVGVEIDKTAIKEFGSGDPRTSDLTVAVIAGRPEPELDRIAEEIGRRLAELGMSFPVRVYSHYDGRYHRDEEDFLATGELWMRSLMSPEDLRRFDSESVRDGFRELYTTVNLPRPWLTRHDLANGALDALLFTASFTLSMRFDPALPFLGFGFGLISRHLARLRAWVALGLGDGLRANALALLFDAALGTALMAGIINPAARLGVPFDRVAAGALLHTLSKGSLRLALDKRFSVRDRKGQALGATAGILLNFAHGLVTGFVFGGALWAKLLQGMLAVVGAWALLGPVLARKASRARG